MSAMKPQKTDTANNTNALSQAKNVYRVTWSTRSDGWSQRTQNTRRFRTKNPYTNGMNRCLGSRQVSQPYAGWATSTRTNVYV